MHFAGLKAAGLAWVLMVGWIEGAPAAPRLHATPQPLWYPGGAAEDREIQYGRVPKIAAHWSDTVRAMLISAPTKADGQGPELNLVRIYGLRVVPEIDGASGRVTKVAIDLSAAKKPGDYPFSIEVVACAAARCVRMEFPDKKETKLVLSEAGGEREFEWDVPEGPRVELPEKIPGVGMSVCRTEEGEDATSTHFYFFHLRDGVVTKVRWLRNGGAQNKPEAVDYEIEERGIKITHATGERAGLPELERGGSEGLVPGKSSRVAIRRGGRLLVSLDGELSAEQRHDLGTLGSILKHSFEERKPLESSSGTVVKPGG